MGYGFLYHYLLLFTLSFRSSISLQPNTDKFYVYDFLQKMGGDVSSPPSNSSSICPWKGVLCESQGGEHIISLSASGLGLHGIIPENTIGKLGKLKHLDLSSNGITGFSSDFWGLGSSLRTLNLSFNSVNGSLSSNIGDFGKVERLDLSHNQFSGEIPPGVSSLSSLISVNISSNMFGGSIPVGSFVGCKFLSSLDASSNNLSGTLSNGFGAIFQNLSRMNLAENHLTGNLPNLSGSGYLTYMNLSGNFLKGPLVGMLLPITLQYLDLSNNQLGDNSQNFSSLVRKLQSLEYLNLSRTNLSGGIPIELSMLVHLKALDLSQNQLTGHVPDFIPRNLKLLDMSWNNLVGEIPSSLQNKLLNMCKFNFSYNNLTICSSRFSHEISESAFIGLETDCPIAVDPKLIPTRRSKHRKLELALAIALSVSCLMVGLVCLVIGCRRKSRQWVIKQLSYRDDQNLSGPFSFHSDSRTWVADVKSATSVPVVIFEKPLLNFTFMDLLSATYHFSRGTLLAEGRFGPVYRASLPGGIHVAVKVLVHDSTVTDEDAMHEFERLGRIKHPNLVPLTGYCIAGDQRIAIYEFMENGHLQSLLHDLPLDIHSIEGCSSDSWEDRNGEQSISSEGQNTWRFRHKIALGAARALAFLHHGCFPQIIHRDVKAGSIFLDSTFEPRLPNSGLAKIAGGEFKDDMFLGSPGYAPPEFSNPETCSATTKSDVYAFGVVLFELVTARKPVGDEYPYENDNNLVNWVRGLVRKNMISKAIDMKIRKTGPKKQMEEALRIGYLCTAYVPSKRPSMQQIVGLLKDIEPNTDQ